MRGVTITLRGINFGLVAQSRPTSPGSEAGNGAGKGVILTRDK